MKFNLLLFLLCITHLSSAQSPYGFSLKQESCYFSAITLMYGSAGFIGRNYVKPLTETELSQLDRNSINSFDRPGTFNLSSTAGPASDWIKLGTYAAPLLFLSDKRTRNDFGKIMLLYSESVLLTSSLTSLFKRTVLRPRPVAYNESAPLSKKQGKDLRYSFFSGHTSVTTTNSFFIAKVFSDYFPDSKWKPLVWSGAVILPAATAYFRVKAGKHFATDVITGFAVGGAIGFLVPHFHKKRKNKKWTISPTSSGMYFTSSF